MQSVKVPTLSLPKTYHLPTHPYHGGRGLGVRRAENIFYPCIVILKTKLFRYCLKIQRRTATDDTKNRNTLQFYFAIIKKNVFLHRKSQHVETMDLKEIGQAIKSRRASLGKTRIFR